MIIGFTGRYAAGKTEAVKHLEKKGFKTHSLSDILREELENRGEEESRERMIDLANELREEEGPEVLAKRTVEKIRREGGDWAIDSIRSPFEVEELRKLDDFILVGLHAPFQERFERIEKRDRPGDPDSEEELKRMEDKENVKSDTNQQLDATFEMAEVFVENDDSLPEFYERLDNLLEGLK